MVEREVFGFSTLHLSYRKEWEAAVAHGTLNAGGQGDGSDGPTIETGELIDFFLVAVVSGRRRAHGCSSLKPGKAIRMPGRNYKCGEHFQGREEPPMDEDCRSGQQTLPPSPGGISIEVPARIRST
jgi:hypothetical protein